MTGLGKYHGLLAETTKYARDGKKLICDNMTTLTVMFFVYSNLPTTCTAASVV